MRSRVITGGLVSLLVLGLVVIGSRWWASSPRAPQEVVEAPAPEPGTFPTEPRPPAIASEESQPPTNRPHTIEVRRGDNLLAVLGRAGLSARVSAEVAAALTRAGANLRRLKPGDTLDITRSPADEAMSVTWQESPWVSYTAVAGESGWEAKIHETAPDVRVVTVEGRVERSLFHAIEEAGEQPQLVIALVSIFEWEFDFTADTRTGDRFRLVVEKRHAGDTFVNYGRILAAQYQTDRRLLTGIAFRSGKSVAYYDAEGRSLRKMFLRSPLEFTRITSGFTYARPHPILGGTRPHLAIDYAAPTGTPIRAVADGVVVRSGRGGGYGNVVQIRHRAGYETLYAHLSRFGRGIRVGARVSQRQVIGYVGATGTATGPHLHYEVIKGGHRVNPLGERFIPGEPIPAARRGEFERHATALVRRLEVEAPF